MPVQLNILLNGDSSKVHTVLQLAVTDSKAAVPVGAGPARMVFGSVIVMLITLYGELPGRPEGEKVVNLVICHGSNTVGSSSRTFPATREARPILAKREKRSMIPGFKGNIVRL